MKSINISLCPTRLEINGDRYDEEKLLAAIESYAAERLRDEITVACLQVGFRQGDEWFAVDGDALAGRELIDEFFVDHGCDEDLFEGDIAVSDDVILALAIVAGENGDHLGSAIYQKAIDRDYSQVALDDDERRRVESLSIEECRALAEEHVRSSAG